MTNRLRIALAQMNPHEGQLRANAAKIRAFRAEAAAAGADLLVTPEFSIAGYPPEDLVLKPAFQAMCDSEIAALAAETADGGPGLIVGGPWLDGGKLYNAAFLLDGKDGFYEISQPSMKGFALATVMGLWFNRRRPWRFVTEILLNTRLAGYVFWNADRPRAG